MATTARLGIDIVATDRTRNGFSSTQRGLAGINRSMNQLKVLAGALAGGNLLAGFIRSITSINAKLPEVQTAFTTLQRAWQAFALAIGEAGFSRALVDFATRMSTLVVGSNGLAEALSRLMSGTLSVLGGAFEGVARAINFAYDNFDILKKALYAFAAVQIAGMVINIGRAFVLLVASLRAASFATALFALFQRRMLVFWAAIIAVGAKVAGVFDQLVEAMNMAIAAGEELLPQFSSGAVEAIRRMGFDVKSLTQDFTAFEGSLAGLPQTFAEIEAAEKKLGKATNLTSGLRKLKEVADPLRETFEDIAQTFSQAFSQGVQDVISGAGSIGDAIRGMVSSIVSSLSQLLINKAFTLLFGSLTNGLLGGSPAYASPLSLGYETRAVGGPVKAGQPYMVGESGREMFVPETNGSIVPSRSLGGGGAPVFQVFNYAPGISVEQRNGGQTPDGRQIIQAIIREEIASGRLDGPLGLRTGGTPRRTRR